MRLTSPLCQDTSICIKPTNNKKVLLEFSCGCIYQMPLERPQPQEHIEDLRVPAVGMLQEWEHGTAGVHLWGLRYMRYLYCKTPHSSALTEPLLSPWQIPELQPLPDEGAQWVDGHGPWAPLASSHLPRAPVTLSCSAHIYYSYKLIQRNLEYRINHYSWDVENGYQNGLPN